MKFGIFLHESTHRYLASAAIVYVSFVWTPITYRVFAQTIPLKTDNGQKSN